MQRGKKKCASALCKLSWLWEVRSWPFLWNERTVIGASQPGSLAACLFITWHLQTPATAKQRGKTCIIDRQVQIGRCGTVVLSALLIYLYCVCAFTPNKTDHCPVGGDKTNIIHSGSCDSIKGGPLEATTEAQIFQSARGGQARQLYSTVGPDNIRYSTSRRLGLNPLRPLGMDAARSVARNARRAHPRGSS